METLKGATIITKIESSVNGHEVWRASVQLEKLYEATGSNPAESVGQLLFQISHALNLKIEIEQLPF